MNPKADPDHPNTVPSMDGIHDRTALRRLRSTRHFVMDLDGTLYVGSRPLACAPPFLETLKQLNLGISFMTNNSSRSRVDYVHKLQGFNLPAALNQIHLSTDAAAHYLRTRHPDATRLWVLGTPGAKSDLTAAGFEIVNNGTGSNRNEPDAVVVAFDTQLTYADLCKTAWWVQSGIPYIATHPDRVCPTDEDTVLVDCGSIVEALCAATGRRPEAITGKPELHMLEEIGTRNAVPFERMAVVGDRLYTDMAMARNAGALGVLVLTGEASAADAAAPDSPADLVVADVGELAGLLTQNPAAS